MATWNKALLESMKNELLSSNLRGLDRMSLEGAISIVSKQDPNSLPETLINKVAHIYEDIDPNKSKQLLESVKA